jgi:hypothetical protein
MAAKLKQDKFDHHGDSLPKDILAQTRKDSGEIVGFEVRWYEFDDDGIKHRPGKSFSARAHGSLDAALGAAREYQDGIAPLLAVGGFVPRPDAWCTRTLNDILKEWIVNHAPEVSYDYAQGLIKRWGRDVEPRSLARMSLERISADPGAFVRFADELVAAGFSPWRRYEVLKDVRAVTLWGRRRHPAALTINPEGLIELPKLKRTRLAYAADAIAVERLIEAVLDRPARDDLLPLRDAAFIAAIGFSVATRPNEWRESATWDSLFPPNDVSGIGSVAMQKERGRSREEVVSGLKSGAHGALLFANAYDRIAIYRTALEERFGPQPGYGLIFQVIGPDGPEWLSDPEGGLPVPVAMSKNAYNHWVKRVFHPAREVAAQAPDTPPGVLTMAFYDLRHTAISMALHSTLVMTPHGMNLHSLASYSGHDIRTLEKYYRHIIARYLGQPAIDMPAECRAARHQVEHDPFIVSERVGPQRELQRRNRARREARSISGDRSPESELIAA